MAVYTPLDQTTLESVLAAFALGNLYSYAGISAGVENTNYFITTTDGERQREFVLTLFEQVAAEDLQFYIDLTTMLSNRGLPVPSPLADSTGQTLRMVKGKPALLVPKVSGQHLQQPNAQQCQVLGVTLAKVHLACLNWPVRHAGIRDWQWMQQTATDISPRLTAAERELLQEIPRFEQLIKNTSLPQAVIHGDLFRDNALFDGNTLTGLIDFNSAGDGFLLFDLAVVVNDWCSKADGSLDDTLSTPLLQAYQQVRPIADDESRLWNDFLRIAALRFWLSRRQTQLEASSIKPCSHLVVEKDPAEFLRILNHRVRYPELLPTS